MAEGTNLEELDSEDPETLKAILADPDCYRGDAMRQAKGLVESLRAATSKRLDSERGKAMGEMGWLRDKLCNADEFSSLPAERQQELRAEFDTIERKLSEASIAAVVRDQVTRFRNDRYPKLLQSLVPQSVPGEAETESVVYVPKRELDAGFSKPWLATEEDVESYLSSLREAYLKAVRDGKRIQL